MITHYALADSHRRDTYADDSYAHLSSLASVEFSRPESPAQAGLFRFSIEKYESLWQAAFEESERIEQGAPADVDWAAVDASTAALEATVRAALPGAANELNERLVAFSVRGFEHWLVYRHMYPKSLANPWRPIKRILERGRLVLVAPTEGLSIAGQNISGHVSSSPLSIVVKSAARGFGWMPIDERYTLQAKVLAFLKQNAQGHENPISLKEIAGYLRERGTSITVDTLQICVTVPLKRSGVVGSTGKGHFFIQSHADLVQSYCFHLSKVRSGQAIMRRYQLREAEFGGVDLQEECEGRSLNDLDRGD